MRNSRLTRATFGGQVDENENENGDVSRDVTSSQLAMEPLLLSNQPWPSASKCKCPLETSGWFHPRRITPTLGLIQLPYKQTNTTQIPTTSGSNYNQNPSKNSNTFDDHDHYNKQIKCDIKQQQQQQDYDRKLENF